MKRSNVLTDSQPLHRAHVGVELQEEDDVGQSDDQKNALHSLNKKSQNVHRKKDQKFKHLRYSKENKRNELDSRPFTRAENLGDLVINIFQKSFVWGPWCCEKIRGWLGRVYPVNFN